MVRRIKDDLIDTLVFRNKYEIAISDILILPVCFLKVKPKVNKKIKRNEARFHCLFAFRWIPNTKTWNTQFKIWNTQLSQNEVGKYLQSLSGAMNLTRCFFCLIFLVLSLFYWSQMVIFEENYHFSRFQRGSNIFQGEGGLTFSRGVQLLIPYRNPYNLWFSRGSGPPVPLLDPHLVLATEGDRKKERLFQCVIVRGKGILLIHYITFKLKYLYFFFWLFVIIWCWSGEIVVGQANFSSTPDRLSCKVWETFVNSARIWRRLIWNLLDEATCGLDVGCNLLSYDFSPFR